MHWFIIIIALLILNKRLQYRTILSLQTCLHWINQKLFTCRLRAGSSVWIKTIKKELKMFVLNHFNGSRTCRNILGLVHVCDVLAWKRYWKRLQEIKEEFFVFSAINNFCCRTVIVVLRGDKVSTSYSQRRLGIGYNWAATLLEKRKESGIVRSANHERKRKILGLLSKNTFKNLLIVFSKSIFIL